MLNKKSLFFFLCPVLLSFLLHFHVFKLDVIGYHVWRQSQTQTVIYNFTYSDNSILHPQRFDLSTGTTALLYEFPLYQWLIAQVNNVIGYTVMNSRLVTFIMFVFFLFGFFKLLKRFVSLKIALITNSLMCFSPLMYYYCVNPLPDTLALCFAIWGLNYFFEFLVSKKGIHFILFAILIALSALVKLPYLLFGGVFLLYAIKKFKAKNYNMIGIYSAIFFSVLIPVILWYSKAIPTWTRNGITLGMIGNDKPWLKLLDYFQFSLISSVPELLTNYASCAFLVCGIILFFKYKKYHIESNQYFMFLMILFSVYFLYELNMIEKTHDYYLMPFIPFIFLVVAKGLVYFDSKKFTKFIILVVCVSPLTAWLRIDQRWNEENPGFVVEYMTHQKQIQTLIPEKEICVIDYDDSKFISLYYLKRKGYSLFKGELSPSVLKKYYLKGAQYFITENESFKDSDYPEFNLEQLYNGELKIFKLKAK